MTRQRLVWVIFGGLIAIGLVALVALRPFQSCTDAGCGDSLQVAIIGEVPTPYTVTLTGDDERFVITCPQGAEARSPATGLLLYTGRCEEQLVTVSGVVGFNAVEVTVRVEAEGVDVERTFRPVWDVNYPNGRRCGPVCYRTDTPLVINVP